MILKERYILLLFTILLTHLMVDSLQAKSYYIDENSGNDNNDGSLNNPWQSLRKVSSTIFQPGDNIYFKRGTSYNGSVTVNGDGTQNKPITIGAYGTGNAPRLTNPNYAVNKGNAMRIRGDFHIVENLYFHHTAPAPSNASSFEEVWEIGALHISMGNDNVIIRNNEFANVPKAIQSYSQNSLITANYIHDANKDQENGFLQNPYWGPIGIQLGIGNQEVSHNRIENMYAVGGAFVADGGAIEIDDGRNHKDNINIHHNKTYHNMGFLEVSYWDDIAFKKSNNIVVEYNLSRDYQSFLLWWAPTHNSSVKNNTIIRDDNEVQGNWNAVFILDAPPGDINLTKNIVVVDNDQTESIFIQGFDGAVNNVMHTDNCYWNVDGGRINLGLPQQSGEIFTDPLFINYQNKNYFLQPNSPAIGWGAFEEIEMDADGDGQDSTIIVDNDDENQNEQIDNEDTISTNTGGCATITGNLTTSSVSDNNAYVYTPQPKGAINNQFRYRPQGSNAWIFTSITNSYYRYLKNLQSGTAYEFQVSQSCGNGNYSEFSSSSFFTTTGKIQDGENDCKSTSVDQLFVTSLGTSAVYIYTPQPFGATNNQFRYRQIGTSNWNLTTVSTLYYRYLVELIEGVTYEYQVRQECSAGVWSSYSDSYTFTTKTPLYDPNMQIPSPPLQPTSLK